MLDLKESGLGSQNIIKNQTSDFEMNAEKRSDTENNSVSSEDDLPRNVKLVKRATMFNAANMYMGPRLFRCNSGIDI